MHTTRPVQTVFLLGALAAGASLAVAQTGMSTEGAMPQSRSASGAASTPHGGKVDKAGKPDADKLSSPSGSSKKPAKAGAQSGAASSPN